MSDARQELLRTYGRFYGDKHFSILWSATNDPKRGDPKRVLTAAWQTTRPLSNADVGEAIFGRGITQNPAINLRGSSLIGIETDSAKDLARVKSLGLPPTLTERSSLPTKLHFYFAIPDELEVVPKVSFRFEDGRLTAAENNYYICAPAIHQSGCAYSHLPGPGPNETAAIAAFPARVYRQLIAEAETEAKALHAELEVDPAAKIPFGQRHDKVFRFACMLRRWTASEELIEEIALLYNEAMCDPPMSTDRVRSQVRGAMKKPGGQELRPPRSEPLRRTG